MPLKQQDPHSPVRSYHQKKPCPASQPRPRPCLSDPLRSRHIHTPLSTSPILFPKLLTGANYILFLLVDALPLLSFFFPFPKLQSFNLYFPCASIPTVFAAVRGLRRARREDCQEPGTGRDGKTQSVLVFHSYLSGNLGK